MSDTRPANFSSVWADLRGVSFKQKYIDAGGIRTRCIESGDRSKPLVLALHGVGGHAEAYSRNFGPHADHFWFVAIDMLGHGWTDKPAIGVACRSARRCRRANPRRSQAQSDFFESFGKTRRSFRPLSEVIAF